MGDLRARAAEVLASVDVVAAEDTRVTGKLLERVGVRARMVSYRDDERAPVAPTLVARIARRRERRAGERCRHAD